MIVSLYGFEGKQVHVLLLYWKKKFWVEIIVSFYLFVFLSRLFWCCFNQYIFEYFCPSFDDWYKVCSISNEYGHISQKTITLLAQTSNFAKTFSIGKQPKKVQPPRVGGPNLSRVDDFRRKKYSEEVQNFQNGPPFRRNSGLP